MSKTKSLSNQMLRIRRFLVCTKLVFGLALLVLKVVKLWLELT